MTKTILPDASDLNLFKRVFPFFEVVIVEYLRYKLFFIKFCSYEIWDTYRRRRLKLHAGSL